MKYLLLLVAIFVIACSGGASSDKTTATDTFVAHTTVGGEMCHSDSFSDTLSLVLSSDTKPYFADSVDLVKDIDSWRLFNGKKYPANISASECKTILFKVISDSIIEDGYLSIAEYIIITGSDGKEENVTDIVKTFLQPILAKDYHPTYQIDAVLLKQDIVGIRMQCFASKERTRETGTSCFFIVRFPKEGKPELVDAMMCEV